MAKLKLNCSSCFKQKEIEVQTNEKGEALNSYKLVCTCGMKTEFKINGLPTIEVHCESSSIPYSLQVKKTGQLPPVGRLVQMEDGDE